MAFFHNWGALSYKSLPELFWLKMIEKVFPFCKFYYTGNHFFLFLTVWQELITMRSSVWGTNLSHRASTPQPCRGTVRDLHASCAPRICTCYKRKQIWTALEKSAWVWSKHFRITLELAYKWTKNTCSSQWSWPWAFPFPVKVRLLEQLGFSLLAV